MAKPGETGLGRVISATRYSWQGMRAAWRFEAAFRQEVMLVAAGFPLAALLARSHVEFLLLTIPLLLLLLTELANSAIESVVDRLGDSPNELSGRAKDMGSAAVFMALSILTMSWLTIIVFRLIG